jgi:hypothetical protein
MGLDRMRRGGGALSSSVDVFAFNGYRLEQLFENSDGPYTGDSRRGSPAASPSTTPCGANSKRPEVMAMELLILLIHLATSLVELAKAIVEFRSDGKGTHFRKK